MAPCTSSPRTRRPVATWPDGTPGRTRMLADVEPGAEACIPATMTRWVSSGALAASPTSSSSWGREVLVTDGTPAGTRVLDLHPGPASSGSEPVGVLSATELLLSATTEELHDFELWKTDGTSAPNSSRSRARTRRPPSSPTSSRASRVRPRQDSWRSAAESGSRRTWPDRVRSPGSPTVVRPARAASRTSPRVPPGRGRDRRRGSATWCSSPPRSTGVAGGRWT